MIMRDPLNKKKRIRFNHYDKEVIVENELSQKKEFKDTPKTSQLTQNNWNMSPYTREDEYKDVTTDNLVPIGRLDKYRGVLKPAKYHRHR